MTDTAYRCLAFDLDGTPGDPLVGIAGSVNHAPIHLMARVQLPILLEEPCPTC